MRNVFADPTFASRGTFAALALNETSLSPLTVLDTTLEYAPRRPPKDWVKGTDWRQSQGNLKPFPTWGANTGFAGAAWFLYARSRGPEAVQAGYRYSFVTDARIGYMGIRFCCDLLGVEGGSLVGPRLGLSNLASRPGEWTYVEPKDFDGEWAIQVRNPYFATYMTLAVSYRAPREDGSLGTNLVFAVQGAAFSQLEQAAASGGDAARLPEEPGAEEGLLEIVGGDYRVVEDAAEAMQPA